MVDYNRNYFWIINDPIKGKLYFFKINGKLIEVSKAVYQVCYNSYQKNKRDIERDKNVSFLSLDYVGNDNCRLIDLIEDEHDLEYEVLKNIMIEILYHEINRLDDNDKLIIISNYIEGKSMRKLAIELNIPVMTLQGMKKRALEKLKQKIK